ncbi:hypothetical protein [Polaromonas aquatica]|uniref:hypothetical protein n=1 Tax=Polaromonas aquatica TaxID=332657 RepID=UPI003D660289
MKFSTLSKTKRTLSALALIVLALAFFFARNDFEYFKYYVYDFTPETERYAALADTTGDTVAKAVAESKALAIFTGDTGHITKGKLLDASYKKEYDQLPEKLYALSFGETIYCVTCKDGKSEKQHGYSVIETNTPQDLEKYQPRVGQENWKAYLKLAIKGAVEYPTLLPTLLNDNYLVSAEDFGRKYGSDFDAFYLKELPYGVKEKLLDFYSSDAGTGYRFLNSGNLKYSSLLREGDFSGQDKKEIAILLKDTREELDDSYLLLVFLRKNDPSLHPEYYIAFNEVFHGKVIIETVYKDPEERWDHKVFMNTEEKVETRYNSLRILRPEQRDTVLIYDEKFDRMKKYIQVPKSEKNKIS